METFFHIDVNSAFLSWEAADRIRRGETTDLRTIPSVVGGDRESRKGVVLAKSVPAKECGIITGEPLVSALRKCPELKIVRENFRLYERSAESLFELLRRYCDKVTVYSIDECFLDFNGYGLIYRDFEKLAYEIKEDIKTSLGFTVSIGISETMLLAKMASDLQKPDAVSTIYPDEVSKKMWNLPVGDLFSVGRVTAQRLNKIGIDTIGDLANADPQFLFRYLKTRGISIWKHANGIGEEEFTCLESPVKSIGNSTTLPFDLDDFTEIRKVMLALCEQVAERLRQTQMLAKTLCVSFKSPNFEVSEHQCSLHDPTDGTMEIFERVCNLFRERWDGRKVRAVGIRVCHLVKPDGIQMNFFDWDAKQKSARLDRYLDLAGKRGIVGRAGTRYGVPDKNHLK